MRRFIFSIIILSTVLLANVQGQPVTESEVQAVANNWIKVITAKKGSWGDSNEAHVASISEFKRKGRTIGYFCKVEPVGYIIVSLRKELAPVKVYSETGNLNPDCEEGLADLIKGKMEQIINGIERTTGPIKIAKTQDIKSILEIDYSSAWDELLSGTVGVQTKESESQGQFETMNYQGGNPPLLTSSWNQHDPYNFQCPVPDNGCTEAHCTVGCVPLAGAQVMRYWAWPPYKDPFTVSYDWANMADRLFAGPTPPRSPQAQIDAVARLCHEVGIECGADYCANVNTPCDTSACFASCAGKDLLDTFEDHFRYSDNAEDRNRDNYSADVWFAIIVEQLNANRPIPYEVVGHVIVCDGWQVVDSTRQYHMNYGWNDANGPCPSHSNAWYTLDELCLGDFDEEALLENVKPVQSLGNWLSGDPPDDHVLYEVPSFPYRYFDQDATARNVTFAAGHHLRFLPGVTVRGTSPVGNYIRFVGTPSDNTWFHSVKGTPSGGLDASIRILDGGIRLYNNGSIRFH